jgi:ribosomal protein S7
MVNDVNREQLHGAVDELPPSELAAALRYLRFLAYEASEEEPIDTQTAAELDAARAETGATISFEEARHRLGI